MQRSLLLGTFLLVLANPVAGQTRSDKVRNDKAKVEAMGVWIYNDLPKAFAQARRTDKPIMVVLRCIPCEECVKLDDELIDGDERIQPLLKHFVGVRVVSTNGLDLSLFQFDTDQSFAVFFLNADGTIYGRFGTRSHRTEWIGDVSIDGLAKAMAGALALHRNYPNNRAALAGKRGPKPEITHPEQFPMLKGKYAAALNYQGDVAASCIHCHQIGEAVHAMALGRDHQLAEKLLFRYPHPKITGLIFDPKEMATIREVVADSPADKAGFQPGDQLTTLAGQPLLSIADVQWVLHHAAADGTELPAEVTRGTQKRSLNMNLPAGWRRKDNLSWRASTWELRRRTLGGMYLVELPEARRQQLGLPSESMALLAQHVGQYSPHDLAKKAGIRNGDVLIGYDGRDDLPRETDVIAYALANKKPGDRIALELLRAGKKQATAFTVPE